MKPAVKPLDADVEYFFAEGCYIIESSNAEEDPALSIARARVEPGRTTRWHFLEGTTERYVILAGEGDVEVGELPPTRVRPGDVVIIPPGEQQRIHNPGAEDLVFLALCTPRFEKSAYVDVEEQR